MRVLAATLESSAAHPAGRLRTVSTTPAVGIGAANRSGEDRKMPRSDRKNPGTGSKPGRNRSDARRPHSIRFSDSEWNLIERAAGRHGIPVGELVRSSALAAAEDRLGGPPPVTLSKGHAALLEEIYRFVYVMATLDRDRLLDDKRSEELDALVTAARRTMAQTMEEGPA